MDTFKDKITLDRMEARGDCPWMVWKRMTGLALLALTLAAPPREAPRCAVHRRPLRRHRDRLRRHLAVRCSSNIAECRVHWLVLTSTPSVSAEAMRGQPEAFLRPSARGELRICGLPDGYLPAHFAEVKAEFEALKRSDLIPICLHASRARPPPGSPSGQRGHLADVSGSPDLGVRDPEVRRRPTTPNMYVPLHAGSGRRARSTIIMRAFVAARQVMVQGGEPARADAPARPRMPRRERVCRSVSLPQAVCRDCRPPRRGSHTPGPHANTGHQR